MELLQASPLTLTSNYALLVAVVIMLVMLLISMPAVVIRPPIIIGRSVRWIAAVVVVAARIITISISRVSSVAVTIGGITEADPDASDPD